MLVSKEECMYCPYGEFDEDGILVCHFSEWSTGATAPCEEELRRE